MALLHASRPDLDRLRDLGDLEELRGMCQRASNGTNMQVSNARMRVMMNTAN